LTDQSDGADAIAAFLSVSEARAVPTMSDERGIGNPLFCNKKFTASQIGNHDPLWSDV